MSLEYPDYLLSRRIMFTTPVVQLAVWDDSCRMIVWFGTSTEHDIQTRQNLTTLCIKETGDMQDTWTL